MHRPSFGMNCTEPDAFGKRTTAAMSAGDKAHTAGAGDGPAWQFQTAAGWVMRRGLVMGDSVTGQLEVSCTGAGAET